MAVDEIMRPRYQSWEGQAGGPIGDSHSRLKSVHEWNHAADVFAISCLARGSLFRNAGSGQVHHAF